ncbi:MAG TPA: response regulator transcription factor [Gaiellaceae bacterium]|nr:response regulator transcription factor [Gaiellaceae bacterium]
MTRLLLADDHALIRSHLRDALAASGFAICAEASDAPAAVAAAVRERPDVCLLDIRMPGNGIAAAAEIRARLPETKVVMLTVSRDDDDLFEALRVGASGYLLKDMAVDRLAESLRDVLNGQAALPASLVTRVIEEFRERGPRRRFPLFRQEGIELTSREWEVLELLRKGRSTAEIAGRLSISPTTVRSHVAAVLRKLELSSREEVVRVFRER